VREYQAVIDEQGAERAVAVLTSAVRDAANGEDFLARVRAQSGALDARVIAGDEEARLTFSRRDERARPPATRRPPSSSTSAAARPSSWSAAATP
jgi:hypothetical protein